ncbi:MAG TPA: D-2-hydroxyacid dehydrogenase [Sphingomonadaceae bacterium]|nr:D-2-hydroxyacid dehydrogenase [Sphingomonadaceae bacterium]
MRVVVWIPVDVYKDAVVPAIKDVDGAEIVVVDDPEKLGEALDGADAIISSGASKYTAEVAKLLRETPSLRWFQTVAAGNEGFEAHGVPHDVVVTSSGGHSAPVVAEHAMALLLATAHCVPDFVRNVAARDWNRGFSPRFRSLFMKTAVVVGLGKIGLEIAKRAHAFDMRVIGVTRSGGPREGVDASFAVADIKTALAEADAVLLAAPLNRETQGVIGAAEFAAMKPGAFLVNIARGGLIDQVALRQALVEGRLAGAALDVTTPEPLPADDPLWDAPNLIVSPHTGGGGSAESPKRLAAAVRQNLEHFIAGKPLLHILPYGKHAA